MLHPTKRHVVLRENRVFYFSKSALGVGTARNKWLKSPGARRCSTVVNLKVSPKALIEQGHKCFSDGTRFK